MARVQLGRQLPESQVTDVMAFLDSLTGSLPADFATIPVLPMQGAGVALLGGHGRRPRPGSPLDTVMQLMFHS